MIRRLYWWPAVLTAVCCWPVWRWYALRLLDGSDEPWGVLALAAALALLLRAEPQRAEPDLLPPALLLFVYAVLSLTAPPIVRAIAALAATGAAFAACRSGKLPDFGVWGLLLLSAPLLSSLQFFLGYPLRWLVGQASSALLRLGGFAVTAEGTLLRWGRGVVEIDAPCSGVRMLWAGLLLACVLISLRGLKPGPAAITTAAAIAAVLAANIARATALFFVETGVAPLPAWTHAGTGVVAFAAAGLAIVRQSRAGARR